MNVTFFYRPKMKGAHSIEAVFDSVKSKLPKDVTYSDYVCTPKWKRFHSFFKASKHQGDVNHITGDIHTIAMFLKGSKTVVTVHDIGHYERDLKGIKKRIFKLIWLTLPLKRVALITTISEITKQKLMDICHVPESKLRVIPNPATTDFKYSPKEFNTVSPVILQIGSSNNKNIYRLAEAIKGSDFRLILLRKPDSDVKNMLDGYGISYEWFSDISREEVYDCYKKCDILFFASESEGFGVPILEANAIGRPILTSNISPMKDVAGDAALTVDPFDINAIKEGLNILKNDSALRETLVQNGLNNIKRFSLNNIAMQYYNVYKEVLQGSN